MALSPANPIRPRFGLNEEDSRQIDALFERVGFAPYPLQEPILTCRDRFVLITGGEQSGKSLLASKYLLMRSREVPIDQKGLYWLVSNDYEGTRREFEYLTDDFTALGILDTKKTSARVDPGQIVLVDGTIIRTKSARDPATLRMEAPDGIIMCEAGAMDFESYHRCSGRVAPKRGWLMIIGTMEASTGWFPALADAWFYGTQKSQRSFRMPSYANLSYYPGGKDDPEFVRLREQNSDEFFAERIEGKPVPPHGAVFGKYFRPDIHIRDIEYDPELPVRLWIDPGYGHAHAIEVVQIVNGVVHVIDEVYENLITEDMIRICQNRWWWRDGMMDPGVVDIAGRQHQAMPSVIETWQSVAGIHLASKKVEINEGVERMKTFLMPNPITNEPRILFSPRCKGILSEFGAGPNPLTKMMHVYSWKTDHSNNIIGDRPEDRWNDGIKAATYGIVDFAGHAKSSSWDTINVKRWRG